MSILKVARIAQPVLRMPAQPVPKSAFKNPLFQKLVDDMRETMHEYEGVGLAAPQVHEGLQLAVIEVGGDDERSIAEVPFMVLVNPAGSAARRPMPNCRREAAVTASRVVLVVATNAITAMTSELRVPTARSMTAAKGCSVFARPSVPSTLTAAMATST